MRLAACCIISAIPILLAPGLAWSEEKTTVLVESRALNKEVVEYVARIGEPRSFPVTKGQTIGSVINAHCGRADDDYIALLKNGSFPGIPQNFELSTPFAGPGTIELPACLYLPRKTHVDPWTIAMLDPSSARFGDARRIPSVAASEWQACSANDINLSSTNRSFEDLDPLGLMVVRDWWSQSGAVTQWSSVVMRSDLEIRPKKAAEHLRALLIAGGQNPRTAIVDDPEEIELYSGLTDSELAAQQACQPRPGEALDSAVDVLQLVEVLSYSLQNITEDKKHPERAVIVIPDTGLYTDGQLPFPTHRVKNKNIFGVPDPDEIRPHKKYKDNQHGTYVATLTLGGPAFMRVLDSLGLVLEVAPFNVFEEKYEKYEGCPVVNGQFTTCPRYRVKTDGFNNAIDQGASWGAIVNLSVGRQKRFPAIERYLSKDSSVLFVAAAGNDGRALSERTVFPARYGGTNDGEHNLITVAALDLNGMRRASFSNHGESYVDIAAPGCWRSVLDYNAAEGAYHLLMASGTSFAAPSVSFVAALLKATWLDATPRAIKRRILTSSDIVPELQRDGIKDGRKLNPVKALSIYQDIVEANVGGKKLLIRGRIDDSLRIFDFCKGALSLHRFPGANKAVVKKVTSPDASSSDFLIYWLNAEGVLNTSTCQKEAFAIKIRDEFTNLTYKIGTAEIIDVIFSERAN